MFHNNSFLLQGKEVIRLKFIIYGGGNFVVPQAISKFWEFSITWVHITDVPLLRRHATYRKVAGSSPGLGGFFSLPNPGVDSASNRNEYQESSWG
jgi:hypothetical protein